MNSRTETPRKLSPIEILARASLSKKEIERLLQQTVDAVLEKEFHVKPGYVVLGNGNWLLARLRNRLDEAAQGLAGFGREKMFSLVIKRGLKKAGILTVKRSEIPKEDLSSMRKRLNALLPSPRELPKKRSRVNVKKRSKLGKR